MKLTKTIFSLCLLLAACLHSNTNGQDGYEDYYDGYMQPDDIGEPTAEDGAKQSTLDESYGFGEISWGDFEADDSGTSGTFTGTASPTDSDFNGEATIVEHFEYKYLDDSGEYKWCKTMVEKNAQATDGTESVNVNITIYIEDDGDESQMGTETIVEYEEDTEEVTVQELDPTTQTFSNRTITIDTFETTTTTTHWYTFNNPFGGASDYSIKEVSREKKGKYHDVRMLTDSTYTYEDGLGVRTATRYNTFYITQSNNENDPSTWGWAQNVRTVTFNGTYGLQADYDIVRTINVPLNTKHIEFKNRPDSASVNENSTPEDEMKFMELDQEFRGIMSVYFPSFF